MAHQPQTAQRDKLILAVQAVRRHLPAPLPGLLALTDPVRTLDPVALGSALFDGCGLVYRHFGDERRVETARALRRVTAERGVRLLIGNDPELARSVGADGVHWPEARIGAAARWQGAFVMMTGAVHSEAALTSAARAGVEAALVSPVYSSASPSAGRPLGAETLKAWAERAQLPIYGLGGVTAGNSAEISRFAGLAMIDGARCLLEGQELE